MKYPQDSQSGRLRVTPQYHDGEVMESAPFVCSFLRLHHEGCVDE